MAGLIEKSLRDRLLASIAGDSLVLLCGAGLSMAPPSCLSSAWQVAQNCAARYRDIIGSKLPDGLADNIEGQAEHFYDEKNLEQLFLKQLIDWSEFVGRLPNKGHLAIADFLGHSFSLSH